MSSPHSEWTPRPRRVVVVPAMVITMLRAVVGSSPLEPLPDEHAATMGRPFPDAMGIDAGAWVAWCLAGLYVCERFGLADQPDGAGSWIDAIGETAKRLVTVLAMRRAEGSIPRAARDVRATRRALGASLRRFGLSPWAASPLAAAEVRSPVVGSDVHVPRAVDGPAVSPGARAIVHALASILERAEALRTDGHDTRGAIVRAASERGASHALTSVAVAAWMLATGTGEASS
jgi:hypothetical protein